MTYYPQPSDNAPDVQWQVPGSLVPEQRIISTKPVAAIADDRIPQHMLCGFTPVFTAGYIVVCLCVVEGLMVCINVFGFLGLQRGQGVWQGLAAQNPFQDVQWALLGGLGLGDLIFATFGAVGMWLSAQPSRTPRQYWSEHSKMVSWCVLSLVFWRFLVAFATAPWVGLILAFEPPDQSKWAIFILTLVYVAASLYGFYVLLMVYRHAAAESAVSQQRFDTLARAEGDQGNWSATSDITDTDKETMFCCPIEWVVATYTVLLAAAFFICFVELCTKRRTIGGWALLAGAPTVPLMVPIEGAVYLLSGCLCVVGLIGILLNGTARDELGYTGRQTEEGLRNIRRSAGAMLVFFLGSVMRVALFIPVTGMALVERNICGVYVRGLAATNLYKNGAGFHVPMHCSGGDFWALVFVVLLASLDIYMVQGTFHLWQRYRTAQGFPAMQSKAASFTYGAAPVQEELYKEL